MSSGDAYERAGVSQRAADAAVAALLESLRRIDPGRPSRQALAAGHYASVIRLDETIGIALSTDGVGTKLVVAEQLGRWDTVGIDCVAMNTNDLICVGAEPLAMLDYVAVPEADPAVMRELGRGLRRGAELAGIEIPGGELAQIGEIVRGLDLVGACFGTVDLNSIVTGAGIEPGDPVLGLPSSGLHSNGYTLARRALADVPLADETLGRPLGDVMLEPTEIYVAAVVELMRSAVEVRGLAHITSGGLGNLLRLEAKVGYEIDNALPAPPIFSLIQERGSVSDAEMYEVFNMGCGFCCVVPARDEDAALELLRRHYPDAKRIGCATADAGRLNRH
ncbi:MAG TPA: phosphoribosylformylglycinamidine cyclo-ligase [Solirubrobacterales bacterium]|jgi:phosphoribosylformylglycinamidine cyclo-ligase|nr:phosphoribosylformylglycinamidine cyclo-ligase [Solirubrobacterales bacterium]